MYLGTDILLFLLQKITVAECIETQSKAMTMLTIDQLSYLLKFALQKIKQPGVRAVDTWHSSSVGHSSKVVLMKQSSQQEVRYIFPHPPFFVF